MRMSSTRLLRHSQHIDHEDELKVKTVLDDVDSTYRPRSSPTTILLLYIMYLRQCLASSCTVVLLSSRASRLEVLCRPLCRFISSPPVLQAVHTATEGKKKTMKLKQSWSSKEVKQVWHTGTRKEARTRSFTR